jgi:hypothetical protein
MFGEFVDLMRADVDRQVVWLKTEVKRQARYAALTAVVAAAAALSALGAVVVGCIALYWWLAKRYGPDVAFAVLGGGFALLAVLLSLLMFARRRPQLPARPTLQSVRPATLIETLKQTGYRDAVTAGEQISSLANDNLRHGSRQSLFGTLVLAALVGLVVGRGLRK